MYNIRLFKNLSDGTAQKNICAVHFEVYEKENGIVLLTVYDNRKSTNGVEYQIHNKTEKGFNSVIIKLGDKLIYKFVV